MLLVFHEQWCSPPRCFPQSALIKNTQQLRVVIYGAGEAGAQLAAVCGLQATTRLSVSLMTTRLLETFHQRCSHSTTPVLKDLGDSVDQMLLAIPSLSRSERRRIVDDLQRRGIVCCRFLR